MKQKRYLKKKKVIGTTERPRMSVFRGANNVQVQIIDDSSGITLAAASSLKMKSGGNIKAAAEVGKLIAEAALKKGLKKIVFDRGKYNYHGRIKALADAARQGGLEF